MHFVVMLVIHYLVQIENVLKLPIYPLARRFGLVIDKIGAVAIYETVLKLSHILSPVSEEEVTLAMFLEVADISVVDLSIGIFNLALID